MGDAVIPRLAGFERLNHSMMGETALRHLLLWKIGACRHMKYIHLWTSNKYTVCAYLMTP